MAGPTRRLAQFIANLRYEDLPPPVVAQAKRCLLDLAGVGLAGSTSEPAQIIATVAEETAGPGNATVFGRSHKSSPTGAALVNGTASHAIELDDGCRFAYGHPGAPTIPAALALAEVRGVSGKDLLTAIVAGYEVFIRVGQAVQPGHLARGFHGTGTVGCFAASAAAARVLGLNEEQSAWALGIAGSLVSGIQECLEDGSMPKPMHPGKAAEHGVFSALLASRGFTGPVTVLEGKRGFLQAMSDRFSAEPLADELGARFRILDVYFKFHSACRHSHSAIDAMLDLAAEHGLHPHEVAQIVVETYKVALDVTSIYDVRTEFSARMSLPFAVACALVKGRVGLAEYEEDAIRDERILTLLPKVKLQLNPELDASTPRKRPAIVTVKTTDGRVLTRRVDLPRGEPENPASDKDFLAKFTQLAGTVLPQDRIPAVIETIQRVDELGSVSELTRLLAL